MPNVLLVEDDINLSTGIIEYLSLERIEADYARSGESALSLITSNEYDVIILDLNIPKIDGISLCIKLREMGFRTPIIMLTARSKISQKLEGFSAGADDYLVKPFSMLELVARIRALSGRQSGSVKKLSVRKFNIDTTMKIISYDGEALDLTPTAFKILALLLKSSPEAVSKEKILNTLWSDYKPGSNSLAVHIHWLRKYMEQNCQPEKIKTIKNYGYVLRQGDE